MARGDKSEQAIIIKRVKKVAGGHHGGAWKVAYADFATAMMAFFMLLWLLTVSDKVQLRGIADYFSPSSATMSNSSGAGSILGGEALASKGAKSSGSVASSPTSSSSAAKSSTAGDGRSADNADHGEKWQAKIPPQTIDTQLMKAQEDIQTAIQESLELSQYRNQILLEQTPDGLRIQIVDSEQRPMFKTGTAEIFPFARTLIADIGKIVAKMPNRITVEGHTDGRGSSGDYSNWELSADRANAARRVLRDATVSEDRIAEVIGKGAGAPLYPDQPNRAENRRVTVLLLHEAPVVAPNFGKR